MSRSPITALLFAAALLAAPLSAAEVRIALAPKITLPKDSPVYAEDTADFYGTNIALLTSGLLRGRAEAQVQKSVGSSLRLTVTRVPNTSIISIVVSGADEAVATSFASALVDQFLRFKREQKARYYRDTVNAVDSALSYVPAEYAKHLEDYKQRLVIASMLDTKPDFERIEY